MNSRRIALAVLVPALALGGTTALATPAEAATTAPRISSAIAGETTKVVGSVPKSSARRTVALQRYGKGRWTTVKRSTTRTGRYSFSLTAPSARTSYRVQAVRRGSARAVTTKARAFVPTPQRATLTLPTATGPGVATKGTAAFSPARPGRTFVVQLRHGSSWRTVTTSRQDSDGRVGVTVTPPDRGDHTYRVVASAAKGAAAVAGTPRVLTAETPEIVDAVGGTPFDSQSSTLSSDASGRRVAFISAPTNAGVPNTDPQRVLVFLKDLDQGTVKAVSVPQDGRTAPNGRSAAPQISGDGRLVVFQSDASNLTAHDGNGLTDVFLWDDRTASTTLLSTGPDGEAADGVSEAPSISPNGRYVAWVTIAPGILGTDRGNALQVVRLDRSTGERVVVSRAPDGAAGNATSFDPRATDSGRVAYRSVASNLVAGDTNAREDVFLWDPQHGTTGVTVGEPKRIHRMTVDGDGDTIVYATGEDSRPTNTVWFRTSGRRVTVPGKPGAQLSTDGSTLLYTPAGSDGASDLAVMAHDIASGRNVNVAAPHPGGPPIKEAYLAAVSGDGRFAFYNATGSVVGFPGIDGYHLFRQRVRF